MASVLKPPLDWRLTPLEARVLILLHGHDRASRTAILDDLYGEREDEPYPTILNVVVCRLRRKLEAHGVRIETIWGMGWRIDPANKIRLSELAAANAA